VLDDAIGAFVLMNGVVLDWFAQMLGVTNASPS
jgi:hypothetical protein